MKAFRQTLVLAAVALMASLSLTACGGGGGGGGTGTGASTTTVSKGVVESFGSVMVNGVKFETVDATLRLRDDATTPNRVLKTEIEIQTLLKKGMVVTVKGRIDDNGTTGKATEIEFRDTLKGRIDSIVGDKLTIMGQTVIVDDSIKSILGQLTPGHDVRVSGVTDDIGRLRATHIEDFGLQGLSEFEAKGFVKNFNSATNTFTLALSKERTDGITIIIGAIVTLPTTFANDAFVEVKAAGSGTTLTASRIEIEDELKAGENENMEFEGFISSFIDANNFVVNGQMVRITDTTIFRGGARADLTADLAIGMKVEAEGSFVGGVLIASKVSFKDNFRINATAIAVSPTAKTVTLLGQTIFFSGATEFNGFTDPNSLFNQNVEIRGILNADNVISATRIDLKGAPIDVAFIRGVVTAKTPTTSLTIAGIAINTSNVEFFRDRNELSISGTAFFDAISLNATAVKAKWKFATPITTNFDPSATPVKEVELEN